MSRIKWQITEDLLIGRVAYERINDSDGKGLGKATQDGIIAVAFRILSHFDIQRSYNPSTGEQLNVIQENGFDRPWYERTHFRVDWSKTSMSIVMTLILCLCWASMVGFSTNPWRSTSLTPWTLVLQF